MCELNLGAKQETVGYIVGACVRENARVCVCLCECGCGCVCQYSTDSKATESDMTCVPAEDQPLANISEYLTPQTISRFGNDAKTSSV